MTDTLPCGHPVACVNQDGETRYCRWCAEVDSARREERERCARICESEEVTNKAFGADGYAAMCAEAIRESDKGER